MTVPEDMFARTQLKGSPQGFRVFTQNENADPGAVPSTTVYRKYCLQKCLVFGERLGTSSFAAPLPWQCGTCVTLLPVLPSLPSLHTGIDDLEYPTWLALVPPERPVVG